MVPKTSHKDKKPKVEDVKAAGDWIMNEEKKVVETKDGKLKLRVLDRVLVHIEVIEPQQNRPKLSLTLRVG